MIFTIGKKKFYFFSTLAGCVFITFIGFFLTLWMIFFTLTLIFFSPVYNQFAFFLMWGAIFFGLSYFVYLQRHRRVLRNLSYDAFIVTRTKLIWWIFWSTNFYLLSCWFLLILIGAFNGFGLKFPIGGSKEVLIYSSASSTKMLGVILWLVHIFCIFLFKTISLYWQKIFLFAHREFAKRRQILATVREEAKTQM